VSRATGETPATAGWEASSRDVRNSRNIIKKAINPGFLLLIHEKIFKRVKKQQTE
jgi:hypothetical protein